MIIPILQLSELRPRNKVRKLPRATGPEIPSQASHPGRQAPEPVTLPSVTLENWLDSVSLCWSVSAELLQILGSSEFKKMSAS